MRPSSRSAVPSFAVMDILGRIAELRADGRDVISLCAGEPSGGAPAGVSASAAVLHGSRMPLTYTPSLGLAELRGAVAEHYRRWYGIDVAPAQVAITTGSSGGFVLAFLAAFETGDRVALPRPGYPAYRNILAALGCEVVDLDVGPDQDYRLTPQILQAAHDVAPLAGVVLASPANPTGTMVDRAQLAALTAWCTAHEVRLVSDEIYHGITYPLAGQEDPRGVCAWEIDRSAVVVSSFSKYWGMTGWRLGWLLMPDELAGPIDALAGNVALCPPAAAQVAATAAFSAESYAECDRHVEDFARTRQLVLDRAPDLGWGAAAPPDGAFYYYSDLGPALGRWGDSAAYARALLEEVGVAIVPGTDFDPVAGHRTVRLSLAAGHDAVDAAIDRIVSWQR